MSAASIRYRRELGLSGLALACLGIGCTVAGVPRAQALVASCTSHASPVQARAAGYTLVVATASAAASAIHVPPLAMRGQGRQARIVDATGAQVWRASEATPLYGLKVGPAGQQVLLSFGDARFGVRAVDKLSANMPLPLRPDVPGATAFGEWHWLDAQRLLGVSELPAKGDDAGLTAAERESRPPLATLLAVFDLRDGTLRNVDIAGELPRVFLVETVQGARVQLRGEATDTEVWTELVAAPQ